MSNDFGARVEWESGRGMNTFSFEQFEVTEANRAAFEACRDVAALRYAGARPLLLLGPDGGGKTHLLWAVVKRVRASAIQASLALVMAREFPDRVRALLHEPGPILGKPAIFLVDELEKFDKHAAELEAVVRLFLEHGHQVVLASSAHPDRLAQFTREFRAMLRDGRVIEVGPIRAAPRPGADAGAAPQAADTEKLHAALRQLKQEHDAARQELEAARAQAAQLRQERDALEAKLADKAGLAGELAQNQNRCAEAEQEARTAHEETARLRECLANVSEAGAVREATLHEEYRAKLAACEIERDEAARQRDDLEREVAGLQPAAARVDKLLARIADLEEETAHAFAQQARLQGQVGALKLAAEDAAQWRTERDEAQQTITQLYERAAALLDHIAARREEWAEMSAGLRGRLELVANTLRHIVNVGDDALGQEGADPPPRGAEAELAALRAVLERGETPEESDPDTDGPIEGLHAEQGRLQMALHAAQARLAALENELDESHRERTLQAVELDTLRRATAQNGDSITAGDMPPEAANGSAEAFARIAEEIQVEPAGPETHE